MKESEIKKRLQELDAEIEELRKSLDVVENNPALQELLPALIEERPLIKVLSEPSIIPLVNWLNRRKIDSYRQLVEAEKGLADVLSEHQRSLNRLRDIDIEIYTDKARRRNELRNELEESLLIGLRRKVDKARLEKELKDLEKPPDLKKFDPDEYWRGKKEKALRKDIDFESRIKELKKDIQRKHDLENLIAKELETYASEEINRIKNDDRLSPEEKEEKIKEVKKTIESEKMRLTDEYERGRL